MKSRMTVTVDPDTLREAKLVLRDTGLSLSGFINLTLQGLVDGNAKPMRQMYEEMALAMMREVTKTDKPTKARQMKK